MINYGLTHWLNSLGGPLIIMEREVLHNWHGSNPDSQTDERNDSTDYERACRVLEYVGTVTVGDSLAIVLGDEPMQTACWTAMSGEQIIVRWAWASDENHVLETLAHLDNDAWEVSDSPIQFKHGNLIMFDSAWAFDEISEQISFQLEPGTYNALSKIHNPADDISLVLHTFQRLP